MVRLTFSHTRDIFDGTKFKPWVYKLFPGARFDSCKWGDWYPTIKVPYEQFEAQYKNIPVRVQAKIAEIECRPSIIDFLAYHVYRVHRITNLHPDFEKYTGRQSYGNKVEEIIDIPN